MIPSTMAHENNQFLSDCSCIHNRSLIFVCLQGPTLTRNAHSLEPFLSEAELLLEHATVLR